MTSLFLSLSSSVELSLSYVTLDFCSLRCPVLEKLEEPLPKQMQKSGAGELGGSNFAVNYHKKAFADSIKI